MALDSANNGRADQGTAGSGTDQNGDASDVGQNSAPPPSASADPLTAALASGDASALTTTAVVTSTQSLLSAQATDYAALKQRLFGLNADGTPNPGRLSSIDWNPTHDSSWFTILDKAQNKALLESNWSYKAGTTGTKVTLGVAGVSDQGSRYAAFGGNPLAVPGNAAMDQFMKNTLAWLTQRSDLSRLKVVTAHLPGAETYWFAHESRTRSWLANAVPEVSINGISANPASQPDNLCDGAQLATCLSDADLLIIGREQGPQPYNSPEVMAAVRDAQARGVPVLYLHHYRDTNDLARRLLDGFGLGQANNYWAQNGLKGFDPASLPAMPNGLNQVQALLNRLDQGSFTSTWSGCANSLGRVSCSADATYMSEFGTPAETIRTSLRSLDANNVALFSRPGYALEKRLVLLGDKYREGVRYPLSKLTSGVNFYRAYFSDMSAFIHRPHTSVAQNLGSFSGNIPAQTPAVTRTVNVDLPSAGTKDFMTGLYVMPGRTVTLRRTDAGTGMAQFSINMLRDTTRVFNEPTGLDRPTQLTSPKSALAVNSVVTITSPYGGPLFLHVDAASNGPQAVTVEVTGVTTHPVLRNANDPTEVAAFQAELASTPTHWVGFSAGSLMLHSTLAHFNDSLSAYSGDLTRLATDTWTYTLKDTYELAGFNTASGLYSLSPSVTQLCSLYDWDCLGTQHRRDVVQHVISDEHALCGAGCSGNPYDQNWAFNPLGWGETHEIGHNLQRSRLNIYGGQSGEVSNNIFPVHKRTQYNSSVTGLAAPLVDRAGVGLSVFNTLKSALNSADPVQAAYTSIWADTAYAANNSARVMFYRQLVEYARHYNSTQLADGWPLFTLSYLLDRNLDAHQSSWGTVAAKYGFSTYASYPSSLNGNDFLLITSSRLIARDMRPMFALWGVTYSPTASAQVAAFGHAPVEPLLFPMSHLSQIPSRVGTPVVMSTTATYPNGY